MLRIDILTPFPEVVKIITGTSILNRAQEKGMVSYNYYNLFNYTDPPHNKIDDYPFGGGSGMIMKPEPIFRAYEDIKKRKEFNNHKVIFPSPDGYQFNQDKAKELSKLNNIIFICGHYKGIDQRIRDYLVTDEISIGDYVISGGELSSMIILDSIVRLIPGVLNSYESAETDTYMSNLLDCPHYTRPREFNGYNIPEVLLSGNHNEIEKWKKNKREEKTKLIRPDIWEKYNK